MLCDVAKPDLIALLDKPINFIHSSEWSKSFFFSSVHLDEIKTK